MQLLLPSTVLSCRQRSQPLLVSEQLTILTSSFLADNVPRGPRSSRPQRGRRRAPCWTSAGPPCWEHSACCLRSSRKVWRHALHMTERVEKCRLGWLCKSSSVGLNFPLDFLAIQPLHLSSTLVLSTLQMSSQSTLISFHCEILAHPNVALVLPNYTCIIWMVGKERAVRGGNDCTKIGIRRISGRSCGGL